MAQSRANRPRAATRGTPAAPPPTLTGAHLQGFVVGCLAGILVTAAVVAWLETAADDPSTPTPVAPELDVAEGPRFDFYTMLPSEEMDLSPEIEPAALDDESKATAQYLLQVGSFRREEDADTRRGELALLGLEATVELTQGSNGSWYRVYVGPFPSRSEMARARSLTAQADMDTLLLRKDTP